MLVQFGQMLGAGVFVQLFNRVLVVVCRFLAGGMNVEMRVLVRVGVLVGVGMLRPVCVRVLVGMDVRMHVNVRVSVLDLSCHGIFLLLTG